MKDKLKDKQVKCRICNGEHFTARCPYKDTMAPIGENGAADVAAGMGDEPAPAGAGGPGAKKGSYVPPALRGGAAAAGAVAGSKYGERDDFATLRVTNVSIPVPRRSLRAVRFANTTSNRFLKWPRRASCATCLSASDASPECFWQRTEKPAWPRALPLSASWTAPTPSRRATRWTDLVSSISFSASSLPRRLSRLLHYSCFVVSLGWFYGISGNGKLKRFTDTGWRTATRFLGYRDVVMGVSFVPHVGGTLPARFGLRKGAVSLIGTHGIVGSCKSVECIAFFWHVKGNRGSARNRGVSQYVPLLSDSFCQQDWIRM